MHWGRKKMTHVTDYSNILVCRKKLPDGMQLTNVVYFFFVMKHTNLAFKICRKSQT